MGPWPCQVHRNAGVTFYAITWILSTQFVLPVNPLVFFLCNYLIFLIISGLVKEERRRLRRVVLDLSRDDKPFISEAWYFRPLPPGEGGASHTARGEAPVEQYSIIVSMLCQCRIVIFFFAQQRPCNTRVLISYPDRWDIFTPPLIKFVDPSVTLILVFACYSNDRSSAMN